MNKITIILSLMVVSLMGLVCVSANAGDVAVNWQAPDNFTDIDPAEQPKDKFEANLFKNFDAIFAGLASKLPDNYHWEVTVTDLDLAGMVKPSARNAGRAMRVVNPIDRPAISFEYKLMDDQNKLVKEAKVDLKDPNFMSRSRVIVGVRTKEFPYEEYMINRWFEEQQNQKVLPTK
jgi:hypothetical protein